MIKIKTGQRHDSDEMRLWVFLNPMNADEVDLDDFVVEWFVCAALYEPSQDIYQWSGTWQLTSRIISSLAQQTALWVQIRDLTKELLVIFAGEGMGHRYGALQGCHSFAVRWVRSYRDHRVSWRPTVHRLCRWHSAAIFELIRLLNLIRWHFNCLYVLAGHPVLTNKTY